MIKRLKYGLSKRKVKIFLLFVLCSSLAWLISNLSESYTSNSSFDLEFVNIPDTLLFSNVSKNNVDAKLQANGFQFLNFGLNRKKINLDLSTVQNNGTKYFIPQQVYKRQIEKQLSSSIDLLDLDNDTIFFDFFKLYIKEIPVVSNLGITLAQNHLLEGELLIKPSTISIRGPKSEIDTIMSVKTSSKVLSDLNSDFSYPVTLVKPEGLLNTEYLTGTVKISGIVSKFSEKIIDVPISIVNLPEGMGIQTFPNTVSILCKAKLDALKELSASDFLLTVDYAMIENNPNNTLPLQLVKIPNSIYSAHPLEAEVEYILKKE
ncbi:hypothetical protein GGR42_000023 [Saonia flava]|uniref:YbbR-like protein n=1 Tax=Saonia flava TaxID=523696 RepID=A0A846QN89_9FLAO|nr:YbbR-like domain-containing protein [Saonia flava]NJB69561.1 hypothetical protein [Saonia flava]